MTLFECLEVPKPDLIHSRMKILDIDVLGSDGSFASANIRLHDCGLLS